MLQGPCHLLAVLEPPPGSMLDWYGEVKEIQDEINPTEGADNSSGRICAQFLRSDDGNRMLSYESVAAVVWQATALPVTSDGHFGIEDLREIARSHDGDLATKLALVVVVMKHGAEYAAQRISDLASTVMWIETGSLLCSELDIIKPAIEVITHAVREISLSNGNTIDVLDLLQKQTCQTDDIARP